MEMSLSVRLYLRDKLLVHPSTHSLAQSKTMFAEQAEQAKLRPVLGSDGSQDGTGKRRQLQPTRP